jgi:hypothetical protein
MIIPFKFFEGPAKKQRVFTDFLDALDDYHLGDIPLATHVQRGQRREVPGPRLKPFTLNLMLFAEVLGRIPTFSMAFESSDLNTYETLRGTTIGQLTSGELGIPWCFTELHITRISDNSHVSIHYNNVDEMDRRGLIFDPQDRVTICYKPQ